MVSREHFRCRPAFHRHPPAANQCLSPSPPPSVEPCFRYGQPAKRPAIALGYIAGQDEEHLPVCLACIELLLSDPEAYGKPLRERRT